MEQGIKYPVEAGMGRWMVRCVKCGYVWLARSPEPKRCALCNNPNPNEPKKYRAS